MNTDPFKILELPEELIVKMLQLLPLKDLTNFGLTSRFCNRVASDNIFWRERALRIWPSVDPACDNFRNELNSLNLGKLINVLNFSFECLNNTLRENWNICTINNLRQKLLVRVLYYQPIEFFFSPEGKIVEDSNIKAQIHLRVYMLSIGNFENLQEIPKLNQPVFFIETESQEILEGAKLYEFYLNSRLKDKIEEIAERVLVNLTHINSTEDFPISYISDDENKNVTLEYDDKFKSIKSDSALSTNILKHAVEHKVIQMLEEKLKIDQNLIVINIKYLNEDLGFNRDSLGRIHFQKVGSQEKSYLEG